MAIKGKHDWIVSLYDSDNKIFDHWIIEDRYEHDAHSEAENEIDRRSQSEDIEDWTMVTKDPLQSKTGGRRKKPRRFHKGD